MAKTGTREESYKIGHPSSLRNDRGAEHGACPLSVRECGHAPRDAGTASNAFRTMADGASAAGHRIASVYLLCHDP
jgi:hypothetical protein